jgi:hypothetical protein
MKKDMKYSFERIYNNPNKRAVRLNGEFVCNIIKDDKNMWHVTSVENLLYVHKSMSETVDKFAEDYHYASRSKLFNELIRESLASSQEK